MTIVLIIKYVAIITVVGVFVYKYFHLQKYRARTNKPVSYKWIGWYDSEQVMGTSSVSRRVFMQTNNRLTTVMWICIALIVLMYLLPAES